MKIKNLGKKISIFAIILAMLVSILFVIIINVLVINKKDKSENIGKNDNSVTTIKATDIYYDTKNYWSKSIIKEIVNENVPVPMGFEYVENKKSELGTIIKNEKDGSYMLWIPYDEKVETNKVDEYYKKCEYEEMDAETIESIKSYGGFYINIDNKNQYETLKKINQSQYKTGKKNAKKIYKEEKQVNSHLIYKEELAQIIEYGNKIGKNFVKIANKEKYEINKLDYGKRKIKIQKIANEEVTTGLIATTVNTYTEIENGESKKIEVNGSIVTIPEGFDLFTSIDEESQINDNTLVEKTGNSANTTVLKIRDRENKNLVYIWVPVKKKVSELKQNLSDYYSKVKNEKEEGLYMYNWEAEDPTETDEYKELVKSIETYGGFYIGESELGYTEDKVITNRARGMKKYKNGNLGVTEGEYYRGNNGKSNTYEKMKEVADVYKENKSMVKSHLTYGIEWDAVMEWLMESRKLNEEKIALDSSTKVLGAKYKSNLSEEINDIKVKGLNGIYGLAGNLLDITQEVKKYDQTNQEQKVKLDKEYIIGRGGSYKDSGKVAEGGFPIASRQALQEEEIKKENIGFRNCLYIKVNQDDSDEQRDILEANTVGNVKAYVKNDKRIIYCNEEEWFTLHGNNIDINSKLLMKSYLKYGDNLITFEHGNKSDCSIRYGIKIENTSPNSNVQITLKRYGFDKDLTAWYGVNSIKQFYNRSGETIVSYSDGNKEKWNIGEDKKIELKPNESVWLFDNNEIQAGKPFEGYLEVIKNNQEENAMVSFIGYRDKQILQKNGIDDESNYNESEAGNAKRYGYKDGTPNITITANLDEENSNLDDDGYLYLKSWALKSKDLPDSRDTDDDYNNERTEIDTQFVTNKVNGEYCLTPDGEKGNLGDFASHDVELNNNDPKQSYANYAIPINYNVKIRNNTNKVKTIQIYASSINYNYLQEKNIKLRNNQIEHIDAKDITTYLKKYGINQSIAAIVEGRLKYGIIDKKENNELYTDSSQEGYEGTLEIGKWIVQPGQTTDINYNVILANQSNSTIYHRIRIKE